MPYTTAHNYLTVHWAPSSGIGETGQFGLRFTGAFPAAGTEVTTASDVSTWWTNPTAAIPSDYKLTRIVIARILASGLQDPTVAPLVFNYSPVVGGAGTSGATLPLQTALVGTLDTGALSGLARKGRIYTPPPSQLLNGNYVYTAATANNSANAMASMLSALSGGPLGQLVVMSKGNTAIPGGVTRSVTGVYFDTKPDTQRRRAKSIPSTKSIVGVVS